MSELINLALLDSALSFDDYIHLTENILTEKIPRAGLYLADNTFRYTRSNLERMNKVMQNMVLNQKLYNLLSDLKQPWFWLVLSEPWCGDASWGTPALYIIASASEQITFKILLRDSHPEIMTKFQTESSDSIPKLICLRKSNLEVLGTWGPRPSILHQQVMTFKNHAQFDYKESVRKIHAWYEKDMTRTTQEEITDLVKIWREKS